MLIDYYRGFFYPGNMIISAAGSLSHERFVDVVRQKFEGLTPKQNGFKQVPPQTFSKIVTRNKKSLEQVQICMGVPSPHISHEGRYVAYVLNTLLGGGMSSRLFQNIRENQGLCYAIYSDLNAYRDTGCLSVCAGTSQEWASKVVESVVGEFRNLKAEEVSPEELNRAKAQLKGSLMLSLESSTSRMSNLARQEMYFDRFFSLDEIIERIESVTVDQLQSIANELFQPEKIAVTVLGNLDGLKITQDQLAC
jgi:predicted Zn-dependent peptidase